MLRNLSEIIGNVLEAKDGEIGRCKDFLFDDREDLKQKPKNLGKSSRFA